MIVIRWRSSTAFRVGALLVLLLLFPRCGIPAEMLSSVRERGVLRVGSTGDYKPMSFRNPATGKYEGFDAALAILHLKGTWFEMGQQYGTAMVAPMRRVLDFANKRATEASDRYLLPHGIPCGVAFLDSFFAGVVAGSGLSISDLVRINGVEVAYGEELVRLFGNEAAGKCSALALFGEKTRDGGMIFGRNYDWLPSFAGLGLVLTVFHPTDSDLDFAMLNYPGCFYLTSGMNSAGVFVELNSGMFASADIHPEELHNAWSLWHVLTQAKPPNRRFES